MTIIQQLFSEHISLYKQKQQSQRWRRDLSEWSWGSCGCSDLDCVPHSEDCLMIVMFVWTSLRMKLLPAVIPLAVLSCPLFPEVLKWKLKNNMKHTIKFQGPDFEFEFDPMRTFVEGLFMTIVIVLMNCFGCSINIHNVRFQTAHKIIVKNSLIYILLSKCISQ